MGLWQYARSCGGNRGEKRILSFQAQILFAPGKTAGLPAHQKTDRRLGTPSQFI